MLRDTKGEQACLAHPFLRSPRFRSPLCCVRARRFRVVWPPELSHFSLLACLPSESLARTMCAGNETTPDRFLRAHEPICLQHKGHLQSYYENPRINNCLEHTSYILTFTPPFFPLPILYQRHIPECRLLPTAQDVLHDHRPDFLGCSSTSRLR